MLRVYSKGFKEPEDTEKFFDKNISYFKFVDNKILEEVAGIEYLGNLEFNSPYGDIRWDELPTFVKLSICLTQCPNEFFSTKGCTTLELTKVLMLDCGNLVLDIDEPLEFYFPVNAETALGDKLESSTDINIRLFHEGGPLL